MNRTGRYKLTSRELVAVKKMGIEVEEGCVRRANYYRKHGIGSDKEESFSV